jgi:hypothetical protein
VAPSEDSNLKTNDLVILGDQTLNGIKYEEQWLPILDTFRTVPVAALQS